MSAAGLAPIRSRDEIEAAIRSLGAPQWARLRKIAGIYARAGAIEAEDLLQEAIARALSTRTCPADVDVVRFLNLAMRSIADGEREKLKAVTKLIPVAQTGEQGEGECDLVDEGNSPDETLIAKQEAAASFATYQAIRALFDDDPVAKDVLDGLLEDLSVEEIRELTGLDKTGYESKRKLIRRRIDRAYPGGWKP